MHYPLLKLLHPLCLVHWLGADIGVFYASRHRRARPGRTRRGGAPHGDGSRILRAMSEIPARQHGDRPPAPP